jgi:hypothetical protein
MKQVASTVLPATFFMLVSCLAYYSTLKIEATCSFEKSVAFNELCGVISQKIELFITTAVRTSNPTFNICCFRMNVQLLLP